MDFNGGNGFLEELIDLRTDPSEPTISISTTNPFCNNGWNFDYFAGNLTDEMPQRNFFEGFSMPADFQPLSSGFNGFYSQFGDEFAADSSYNNLDDALAFVSQEDLSVLEDEDHNNAAGFMGNLEGFGQGMLESICSAEMPTKFEMGLCPEGRNRSKKVNGQPSKNLMAERRRRKRLNDRLSMLRSVVPKISKMDRTSILGDTIDYMKELLEKIDILQDEMKVGSYVHPSLVSMFKDEKPNEILMRNSPKFDVERRNSSDTRVEICCVGKPGLLVSTLTTLEALGLEIQQCVVSCFSDFSVHASCFEEAEQRGISSSEDVKQALIRNAGFGGRFLH